MSVTDNQMNQKYEKLKDILRGMGKVVVAFSGGVDSAFLLKAALEELGSDNVLAITADSETYPAREKEEAIVLARSLGAPHEVIPTSELNIPAMPKIRPTAAIFAKKFAVRSLDSDRRSQRVSVRRLRAIADDLGEHRPGLQAAHERGVRAPLLEAGILKSEIRHMSRLFGLKTWDKLRLLACLREFHTAS